MIRARSLGFALLYPTYAGNLRVKFVKFNF
jgi:hypothetical protein